MQIELAALTVLGFGGVLLLVAAVTWIFTQRLLDELEESMDRIFEAEFDNDDA